MQTYVRSWSLFSWFHVKCLCLFPALQFVKYINLNTWHPVVRSSESGRFDFPSGTSICDDKNKELRSDEKRTSNKEHIIQHSTNGDLNSKNVFNYTLSSQIQLISHQTTENIKQTKIAWKVSIATKNLGAQRIYVILWRRLHFKDIRAAPVIN